MPTTPTGQNLRDDLAQLLEHLTQTSQTAHQAAVKAGHDTSFGRTCSDQSHAYANAATWLQDVLTANPEPRPSFDTPRAATVAVKRALKENGLYNDVWQVSTARCTDAMLTSLFVNGEAPEELYTKAGDVFRALGYRVELHRATAWIALSSDLAE